MNIPGYDEWKLSTPWDDEPETGVEPDEPCRRWQEPDEDCPRPWRCSGHMQNDHDVVCCDTCGAIA